MTTSRSGRRRPPLVFAAVAVTVALVAGGCTQQQQPSAPPSPSPSPNGWTERGPITLALGPDGSGVWTQLANEWNKAHLNEQVTLRELPEDAARRHDTIAQIARARSGELTVIAVDSTWITEFAQNGWLSDLPDGTFPTTGLLASRVSANSSAGKLYAYPVTADVGVLYYRADLLAAAGVKAPRTWSELSTACTKALGPASQVSCYGAALAPSESLTVNVAEAVSSAGGVLVTGDGIPDVDSTNATLGLRWLAGGLKDSSIPSEALNWNEESARQAFLDGRILFLRDWSDAETTLRGTPATGERLGVAQIPGRSGTGTAVAGGIGLGISSFARNQATAADFIRWVGSDSVQRELLEKGSAAPAREALYDDAGLGQSVPQLATVAAAVRSARPLPATAKWGDVSSAIQAAAHPVLKGTQDAGDAMEELQTRLTELLK